MTSHGRYFVTVFMQNTFSDDSPTWQILVTGTSPSTSVSISRNKSNFKKDVKVGNGETATIEVPNATERKGSGLCTCSLIIKANAEITVMTRNFKKTSGDVAVLHPVDYWGVEYYIITPYNGPSNHYMEFGVVANEIPTMVTIVLGGNVQYNGKNYRKGDTMTINLEPFQFLQLQSKDDLSGTRVTSQYPIAVLSGHSCAPSNAGGCSHVYEQLLPTNSFGTSFLIPSLTFQANYDLVFILASLTACMQYELGGQTVKVKLESGNVMKINISASSPLSIHSTERIQVLLFSTGGKVNGKPFGPFLTKIPDIDSFDLTYNLIGQKDFDNNLAIIIAKTSSGPGMKYNGKALQNAKWAAFPRSEYSWSEYNYGGGSSSNRMQHSTTPFGLLTIGYSMDKSYGSVAAGIQGVYVLFFIISHVLCFKDMS